ncbi:MAG TPA: Hsp20/alpha crystallin family protein [Bdellovibrionota bacterium]|jgi:HSP20 family protein|nr:Hsp20/alpha crystallin family protein [Bdellovibrionota bacterium]
MTNSFFNLMTRPTERTGRTLDELFGLTNHLWSDVASDESSFLPSVDVQETSKHWAVMLDVPGVKKEDIKIDLEGRHLTIRGRREAVSTAEGDDDGKWSHVERRYGQFTRSFSLPELAEVESIKADHRDGVLKIVIPKKAAAAKKLIEIASE